MSDAPRRIQRKRTRGWRMPEGAVYAGRPTKWGNPYKNGGHMFMHAVELYERWLKRDPRGKEIARAARRELRGRDLACWCALGQPCHADVLLEIANAPDEASA